MCLQKRKDISIFNFVAINKIRKGNGFKVFQKDGDNFRSIIHDYESYNMNQIYEAKNEITGFAHFRYISGFHIFLKLEELFEDLEFYKKKAKNNEVCICAVSFTEPIEIGYDHKSTTVIVSNKMRIDRVLKIV